MITHDSQYIHVLTLYKDGTMPEQSHPQHLPHCPQEMILFLSRDRERRGEER
jgi:hypothetical protein